MIAFYINDASYDILLSTILSITRDRLLDDLFLLVSCQAQKASRDAAPDLSHAILIRFCLLMQLTIISMLNTILMAHSSMHLYPKNLRIDM
jgi:hypothetical protein